MTEENAMIQTFETVENKGDYLSMMRKLLTLFILGLLITIVGLVLVVTAVVVSQGNSTSFGGVILIGPIPIVFGAGPGAQWLILFAIIMAILSIIMLLMLRRKPGITRV